MISVVGRRRGERRLGIGEGSALSFVEFMRDSVTGPRATTRLLSSLKNAYACVCESILSVSDPVHVPCVNQSIKRACVRERP